MLAALPAIADQHAAIVPEMSFMGARLLLRTDPQGNPDLRSEPFGPLTLFVYPVAVAATLIDFYIADAGLSALFRYDPTLDAMMVVPGVRVTQHTRIAAHHDGSVIVVDRHLGMPARYSRGGRLLQNIDPRNTGSRFDDIAADHATGRFVGLDRVQRRIEEIQPLGRSGAILPEAFLPRIPTAMAVDDQNLYVFGQDCQCVVAVHLSRRDQRVLAEDVGQVTSMAAGDGWLVVADELERVLRIYRGGVLRGDPDYQSLQLTNPQGMAISRGILYVADPGARRVATFRLKP